MPQPFLGHPGITRIHDGISREAPSEGGRLYTMDPGTVEGQVVRARGTLVLGSGLRLGKG